MSDAGQPYRLRPPQLDEFEALYAIGRASMGAYIEATWGPWDDAVQREFMHARLERGLLQVIDIGGEAAGLLEVDDRFTTVYLQNIQLAPGFQRRGIGSAIIAELQSAARRRAVPIELQVLKANPAIELYRRLAFGVTGESPTHWQMRWEPA
ncbi:MAG: GNAT family N-acetyltransferase [Dehalococcoidia bacterium]